MTLDEFLRAEAAKPFLWGHTDCALTADRWVTLITGMSPLAVSGRIHRCESDARKWLEEPGGIAVAVNRVMRRAGFVKTKQPIIGDVGLVVHKGKLAVAIHAGSFWFTRDEAGLSGVPLAACWKAWRVR
jgi:hypothetical protein